MNYIIDTNIAYYLSGIIPCDKNFDITKFRNDQNDKFISSVSLLELYIKYENSLDIFKQIIKSLLDNNIGIIVYGHDINFNMSLTFKKLYFKPKSYLKRIFEYFKKTYLKIFVAKIEYLGILIGSFYYGLNMLLENKTLKLKDFNFPFISLKDHGDEIIKNQIEKDIIDYWHNNNPQNRNRIYSNIRGLILTTICFFEIKKNIGKDNEEEFAKLFREKNETLDIDCKNLLQKTCKERNYKSSYLFKKFESDLKSGDLDFQSLVSIVEFLFLNNKMEFNDFADSTIISICSKSDDFSVLTSDKDWQEFVKISRDKFHGAKNSYDGLCKFYKHIGY